MSCPHFDISIRQRSKRQSAVAGAAYQSGEKLFSEYDNRTKNYEYKAKEVVAKGILLPSHAPPEYEDRQILWNSAEKAETQWNAQLARGIIMALPNEIPREDYVSLVRDYCMDQFVSRGMIADYAIHDKGDGNPHAHILLTLRAMDEKGKWLPKAHKVYDTDENGDRIKLPSGEWKTHRENTADWDQRSNAELWRSKWAEYVNRYYEKNGIPVRLDLRSFERQGKDQIPTIHLGPAVAHLENKGIRTEIGDYNREIVSHNSALISLRRLLASLTEWLRTAIEKLKRISDREAPPPTILDYVKEFVSMRKLGRADWNIKGKQTASVNDLKFISQVYSWMQMTGIHTLEDLSDAVCAHSGELSEMAENRKTIRKLDTVIKHIDTFNRLKSVADQSKRGFERTREKYAASHKEELDAFKKSVRYLKANDLKISDRDKYATQRKTLICRNEALEKKLCSADFDPELINRIRYCIDTVQKAEVVPNHEMTIRERLDLYSETSSDRTETGTVIKQESPRKTEER